MIKVCLQLQLRCLLLLGLLTAMAMPQMADASIQHAVPAAKIKNIKLTPARAMSQAWYGRAKISPDAKRTIFIKKWAQKNSAGELTWRYQLWYKSVSTAAYPVAFFAKYNVDTVLWLADSQHILVRMSGPHASAAIYLVDCVKQVVKRVTGAGLVTLLHLDSWVLSPDGRYIAGVVHHAAALAKLSPLNRHGFNQLVVMRFMPQAVKLGAARIISSKKWTVGGDRFIWLPDNRHIIFVAQHHTAPGAMYHGRLLKVDVTSLKTSTLTTHEAYYNYPVLDHTGRYLAYVSNQALLPGQPYDRDYFAAHRFMQLCVMDLHSQRHRCFAPLFSHNTELLGWNKNDKGILLTQDFHLTVRLVNLDLKSQQLTAISHHRLVLNPSLDANSSHLVFISMTPDDPPRVVLAHLPDFKLHIISPKNRLKFKYFWHTKRWFWYGHGHQKLEGWLTLPAANSLNHNSAVVGGVSKQRGFPLLIAVHGGPANHWYDTYIGSPHTLDTPICFGCLAASGIAVFRPNVHGSSSYGEDFLLSNYQQLGKIDADDIKLALHQLLKQHIADPRHIGIWGWSYGGFMASWLNENSSQFVAALAGAGISDWVSLEGTSNYHTASETLGVPFWRNAAPWLAISPVFHVQSSHAPLLIQAGDADQEVPLSQSLQLYYALRQAHRPVVMRIYADQQHEFSDPNQLLQAMQDAQAWFELYLLQARKKDGEKSLQNNR